MSQVPSLGLCVSLGLSVGLGPSVGLGLSVGRGLVLAWGYCKPGASVSRFPGSQSDDFIKMAAAHQQQ